MRKRRFVVFGTALLAVLAAVFAAAAISPGSSHREAPLSALDPTGDDTDVYAFKAPDAPNSLTLVANWIPFEDPAGGPNFYRFDDRATYYLNVDNTGDGAYDIRYRFRFRTSVGDPNSFLYAAPTVDSIDSPNLNVKQRYSVVREDWSGGHLVKEKMLGHDVLVAPDNVGPKTIPNYGAVANQAITALPDESKVFAGQRDDPFFVDLGATFDALTIRNGTGNAGGGKDDLAGYGVHSIVLQVPVNRVTRDRKPVSGQDAPNAVVGVWASTERRKLPASNDQGDDEGHGNGNEVQVSRLGNPLVNEVVIPLGLKDKFNRTQPQNDAANFGTFVLNPQLAKLLNILYPGLDVPETNRTDIVTALLTGIPGLTRIGSNPAAADTLKINLGVRPAANPKRFGVIAGDSAGFPNGRRLIDDVVDIEERVVGGELVGHHLPLGDGVDRNDKPFLSSFPYLAAPDAGPDSTLKRNEPTHQPVPAPPDQ
ncbi:MAG: DUF4331 domain-containing protein [Solirubrobacteraceae bacterium]